MNYELEDVLIPYATILLMLDRKKNAMDLLKKVKRLCEVLGFEKGATKS